MACWLSHSSSTLATQITTLPLIILYFGQISLVALPVNLLILPVQSLLLALGLAGAGIGLLLQDLGALLLWANLPLLSWMIDVVRAFASWDMAQLTIAVDPRLIQAFYALFIGGAILHKAKRRIFERALKALGSQRMTLALSAVGANGAVSHAGDGAKPRRRTAAPVAAWMWGTATPR